MIYIFLSESGERPSSQMMKNHFHIVTQMYRMTRTSQENGHIVWTRVELAFAA